MVDKIFNAALLILVIAFAQAILFKGPVLITLPGLIVGVLILVVLRYTLARLLKKKSDV